MTSPTHDPAAASRAGILFAVWQVIASRGIDAVSFRAVAAAAGVSVGRVQHHFPTRTALIRAAARHMIDSAEQAHPDADTWTMLTHTFDGAAERRYGTGIYYAFIAASATDPEIRETLREARAGVAAALASEVGAPAADRLLALSEGLTLHVHLGLLTPTQAEEQVRAALDACRAE